MSLTNLRPQKTRLFSVDISELIVSWKWAVLDVKCRYRRSTLGPFWEALNSAVLILGITVIYGTVIAGASGYDLVLYIGLGVMFWSYISTFFIDGATTLIDQAGLVTQTNIPHRILIYRRLMSQIIVFAHIFTLYPIAMLFLDVEVNRATLYFPIGFALVTIQGVFIISIASLLCTRFRDLIMITRNIIQVSFFVTPIFWNPEALTSDRLFVIEYNIFYHMMVLVRNPLLGEYAPTTSYIIVSLSTLLLIAINHWVKTVLKPTIAQAL